MNLFIIITLMTLTQAITNGVHPHQYDFPGFHGMAHNGSDSTATRATKPERIVSLSPSHTEILFALGAGPNVAGVTAYCSYPPEAKTRASVGEYMTPNLEKIVALNPDLVIAVRENAGGVVRQLDELGIPVYVSIPSNLPDVFQTMAAIGHLTGQDARADSLITQLNRRLQTISDRLRALPQGRHPLVFLGPPQSPPFWLPGPGTFGHDLIHRAGGRNLGTDSREGTWNPYSLEQVVLKNPDIIVIPFDAEKELPDDVVRRARAWLFEQPIWQHIHAVRQNQIYAIDQDLVSRTGPRLLDGLEQLARVIHPEIFGTVP